MDEVAYILDMMKRKEITPYKISQYTNIAESTIGRILNGKTKKPNASTLKLILAFVDEYKNENTESINDISPPLHGIDPNEFIDSQKKTIKALERQIELLEKELKECLETKKFTGKQISGDA